MAGGPPLSGTPESARNGSASRSLPGAAWEDRPQLGRNLTYGLLDLMGGAIVAGHFDDKPFPAEAELAEQHGVSLAVTREAVKMLAAKGLLDGRPRHGTFVQPSSSWSLFDTDVLRWLRLRRHTVEILRQFNQLRVAIEPAAATLAARSAQPADIRNLSLALARLEAPNLDSADALEAEIDFHISILRCCRNPFYVQFQEVVATALRISNRYIDRSGGPALGTRAYAAACQHIVSGDCESARSAVLGIICALMDLIDDSCRQRSMRCAQAQLTP